MTPLKMTVLLFKTQKQNLYYFSGEPGLSLQISSEHEDIFKDLMLINSQIIADSYISKL